MIKNRFLQHVQKIMNTSTEHHLEFLMLLKGNSFQSVTFSQESTKSYRRKTSFLPKRQRFAFFCAF